MSEHILNALVQLFALISDIHEDTVITGREKNIVRSFLARHLNSEQIEKYMAVYEEGLSSYTYERMQRGSLRDMKKVSLNAVRILAICEKINEELRQNQKIYVLVQLLDYISLGEEITGNELEFLQTVAVAFNVSETEYRNIRCFIMESAGNVPDKERVLLMDGNINPPVSGMRHAYNEKMKGSMVFLHIPSTNTYLLRYIGHEDLYLNGQNISPERTYIFDHGSTIRGNAITPVYYTEIVSLITDFTFKNRVAIDAIDVTYRFRHSENGIHNLNFHEESGRFVGILGGSGVGKSTTLSILNGTLKPHAGSVLVNGYDLYDEKEKEVLKGVIGFVPQDDLLIEDLTVFQNLYYSARLCLNNLTEDKIIETVNRTLIDFDLEETRDLKVGNPLKKIISGGQRKRLNIALELLREPTILFVDEPTSGLSSVDSEMVMNLLKAQTYKGKLVVVNIHQPGSEIYKMFDKIMIIDKGGHQVYFGNPTEAIVYFKRLSYHANPDEDQCIQCGNINTEQILQIIETKVIDEKGKPTRIRKVSPVEWAERFRNYSAAEKRNNPAEKKTLPENNFSIPGLSRQSAIFFTRDFLSKIADYQYLMISLLGPPLLALLLAYFTRFSNDGIYRFSENENIAPFLFMTVITSLFFGLMISSEEIVKDRKLLKRESFLNLSWFSYLNSKILMMFIISAIQTFSIVLIGNLILGIKGMLLPFWIILFTTSCVANIIGLNISSAFNSVITIYILIPFIIIPQLLFSGVLVKFDRLNIGDPETREYVPVIGDLMPARWSFEALAVKQFRDNEYEKNLFREHMLIEENKSNFDLVNYLENQSLRGILASRENKDLSQIVDEEFSMWLHNIKRLGKVSGIEPGGWINGLTPAKIDPGIHAEIKAYLDTLRSYFSEARRVAADRKDTIEAQFDRRMGKAEYIKLREKHENKRLTEFVLNRPYTGKLITRKGNRIIFKSESGFRVGTSQFGRAHFYAPYKLAGNIYIDTFFFNLLVIWVVSLILYIALYYKLLSKMITGIENLRLPKLDT